MHAQCRKTAQPLGFVSACCLAQMPLASSRTFKVKGEAKCKDPLSYSMNTKGPFPWMGVGEEIKRWTRFLRRRLGDLMDPL